MTAPSQAVKGFQAGWVSRPNASRGTLPGDKPNNSKLRANATQRGKDGKRTELQKLEIRVNCQKEDVKPSEPKPE
jgi:hypothetical protein